MSVLISRLKISYMVLIGGALTFFFKVHRSRKAGSNVSLRLLVHMKIAFGLWRSLSKPRRNSFVA